MCHQNDTASVAALIDVWGDADYLRVTPRPQAAGIKTEVIEMQAVVTTRPNSLRALFIVVVIGAALAVAMLGGYAAGSRPGNTSNTNTPIYQPSSGQSGAPLHGHFGGFQ
jgi:hypothetical protein